MRVAPTRKARRLPGAMDSRPSGASSGLIYLIDLHRPDFEKKSDLAFRVGLDSGLDAGFVLVQAVNKGVQSLQERLDQRRIISIGTFRSEGRPGRWSRRRLRQRVEDVQIKI